MEGIAAMDIDLTQPQREATKVLDQNLQIIACAGSGKTRVVATRVVNILKERAAQSIVPENVVAFTFTEKAAAELKDRITQLHQHEFGHVQGLAGMYVGTIHGFCLDLLQRYLAPYLKYDVLDEMRQQLFVDRNSRRSGLVTLGLKRWVESRLYLQVLGVLRGADVDMSALAGSAAPEALNAYQDLLDAHRYLDYDEILLRAVVELMKNGELRDHVQRRVKYLTVDEYQDVNPIQELLIREMHDLGANLCVVGDDDQNIYQWRGSDVLHIVGFADRYPDVRTLPLVTNFRSTSAIVDVARQAVEVNPHRLAKKMVAGAGNRPYERGDLLALKLDNPEGEAEWIAGKIASLRGLPYPDGERERGLSWADCAVLMRTMKAAVSIVAALKAHGIPYVVTGMSGLFDTAEAQAAAGIFQFTSGLVDPSVGIDEDALRALWMAADVGLSNADLDRGVALLDSRRRFDPGNRFSTYNLQRTYLDFLAEVGLREDRVPNDRGEVVFFNLGKFSQVITDYEEIHYKSRPEEKHPSFVKFLIYQAPSHYPEGGQDAGYAVPDAVRVMTVHQAKGMEFPVVFLPCLQKNRFPSKRQHNKVWDHLPRAAVRNADRYDGTEEDERRLFYVALTRAEKYLFCTWAPDPGNQLYRRPSPFFEELTRREQFLTGDVAVRTTGRQPPEPRRSLVNVELSFSELKYFFECPYGFKLRFLYGFNAPLHEALGYGRSLHNALADVHRRALAGEQVGLNAIPDLLDTHIHVRYAYPKLEEALRGAGEKALELYLREHGPHLDKVRHSEEQIELALPGGIVVHGRIDLIKRTDTNETIVVDFKSVERAQPEDITRAQLHVYALGYEQRFGEKADLIEVHNLDHGGSFREVVDDALMRSTLDVITDAGDRLRTNRLDRRSGWCKACETCDHAGICRQKPAATPAI